MIASSDLGAFFVKAADTLVQDFDLVEFLQELTENASRLSGAEAVGLMLADHDGILRYVASSNADGELLELLQVGMEEGPCRDCFVTRAAVVNAQLTSSGERWPRFEPRAVEAGYRSVHSFPLRLRDEAVGAMGIFGASSSQFGESEVELVQALADTATIGILQSRALARAETLTEQLQGALNSRIVIEQAKGAVSMIAGVGVDEAFTLLRNRARHTGTRLGEVAAAVIADPRGSAGWWS
ncbi:MAG: GAF and ANTAR domain-containing protein [Nocardioidaceae bacterium]|nr:GAF and ANTAR domain-containing protein [Nocardioidaceae bacterium]